MVNGHKITKHVLIQFLIKKELTPIRHSQFYTLIKKFHVGELSPQITWTDICKKGIKAYLSPSEFMNLVEEVKSKSLGGHAVCNSEIMSMVENYIIKIWKDKDQFASLPERISFKTLSKYTSLITSQNIFTVHRNAVNKTESRSVAE